jgi:hypothetical protein
MVPKPPQTQLASPTQVALPPKVAEPTPPPDEEKGGAGDEVPRRRIYLAVPSWLVSGIVHAMVMLILALMTGAIPDAAKNLATITVSSGEAEPPLERVEFDLQPMELQDTPNLSTDVPDLGAIAFGDVAVAAELPSAGVSTAAAPNTTMMDIGALFGSEGLGMSELGPGEGSAMFFGVATRGRRIVYVVDNSNSMNGGKFETACAELLRSVEQLDEDQKFYVIFFSDTAYPLFYPHSARQMMPATAENKRRLKYWLDSVQRCLKTKGEEAMRLAFATNPEAIYILGDGAFTDNTVEKVLSLPDLPVTIHTLGFRMKGDAKRDMQRIAQKFHGTFTEVQVSPEMISLSKKLNRPLNTSVNGAWGITLGAGRAKPAKKNAGKKRNRR